MFPCVCVMLLAASQLISALHHPLLNSPWKEWKINHGKYYEDDVEEEYRMNIWEQNLKMIQVHNQEEKQGKHSYTLEMNQFGDMTLKDISVHTDYSRLSRYILNKLQVNMIAYDEVSLKKIQHNMNNKMASYDTILLALIQSNVKEELEDDWKTDYKVEEILVKMAEHNRILRSLILKEINEQLVYYNSVTRQLVLQEMKEMMADLKASRHIRLKVNVTESLPKSIDYRKKNLVTPVKDQGKCGSCWAFSAAGAFEGQLAKKTGQLLNISSQNLVDCVVESSGCEGGFPDLAFEYVQKQGYYYKEEDYPYVEEQQRCRSKPSSAVAAQGKGFKWIPKGNEQVLAEALHEVGPLSVLIGAGDEKFLFYKSGVYYNPKCEEDQLSHAMLLVGYSDTPKGEKYWIVKNSWGKLWGEKGYIRIARNRGNHCGIASDASYPLM